LLCPAWTITSSDVLNFPNLLDDGYNGNALALVMFFIASQRFIGSNAPAT